MNVSYFVRTTKAKGMANLYFQLNKPSLGLRISAVNTYVMVDIETWSKVANNPNKLAKFWQTDEGKAINDQLTKVKGAVDAVLQSGEVKSREDKAKIDEAIKKVVMADAIKQKEDADITLKKAQERNGKKILVLLEVFMDGIRKGTVLTRSKQRYGKDTIRIYEDFEKVFRAFVKADHYEELTFDEINEEFANAFDTYMIGQGFMDNTIAKNTNCIRRICRYAADKGLLKEIAPLSVWHTRNAKSTKATPYLEENEINALYDTELSGELEKVRDVFFFDLFAAQRISDFEKFNEDNFIKADDGTLYLYLTQQKTGAEVIVPIVDNRVIAICQKYNYNLPTYTPQALNRYIKIIMEKLAANIESLREQYTTVLTTKERESERYYADMMKRREKGEKLSENDRKALGKKIRMARANNAAPMQLYARNHNGEIVRQKWELISSHTCRRTWVTQNLANDNLSQREMMSVTGHKNARIFESYDKRKQELVARGIARKLKAQKSVEPAKDIRMAQ